MKIFSKGPFAAIFWGGLLAGVLDLTQAFIGFSLMGSTPFRIPLGAIWRDVFGVEAAVPAANSGKHPAIRELISNECGRQTPKQVAGLVSGAEVYAKT